MSAILALMIGGVIHSDYVSPNQEVVTNTRIGIEYQEKYWTVGVRASVPTPKNSIEGYVYGGIAHSFKITENINIRPLVGYGVFLESETRHPWHNSLKDGISPRGILQIEANYKNIGVYVSKISTFDNKKDKDAASHLWDQGGAGTEIGLKYNIKF